MAVRAGLASRRAGMRWPSGRTPRFLRAAQAAPWPAAPTRGCLRALRRMCAAVATICCDRAGGLDAPAARTRDSKNTQKGRCDTSRDGGRAALTAPRRQTTLLHGALSKQRGELMRPPVAGGSAQNHTGTTRRARRVKRDRGRARRPRRPRPALAGALAALPGGSALHRRCPGCPLDGNVSLAQRRSGA